MTAVVLSSDRPDTWLRELMLSHYNGGIAARGETSVFYAVILRERAETCEDINKTSYRTVIMWTDQVKSIVCID